MVQADLQTRTLSRRVRLDWLHGGKEPTKFVFVFPVHLCELDSILVFNCLTGLNNVLPDDSGLSVQCGELELVRVKHLQVQFRSNTYPVEKIGEKTSLAKVHCHSGGNLTAAFQNV